MFDSNNKISYEKFISYCKEHPDDYKVEENVMCEFYSGYSNKDTATFQKRIGTKVTVLP
jgi:hypothetical protein